MSAEIVQQTPLLIINDAIRKDKMSTDCNNRIVMPGVKACQCLINNGHWIFHIKALRNAR